MYLTATDSNAGIDVFIPSEDEEQLFFFEDFSEDLTAEELLYSINNNVMQLNLFVGFTVTVGFALLIVYIILRPVFYFLK